MKEDVIVSDLTTAKDVFFGHKSFIEFIYHKMNSHKNRPFIIDGVTGKCETFKDVFEKAKILARALSRLGVSPGDTVGVSSENRLEYPAIMLASLFAGVVFAPINPTYSPDEIVHAFGITKPRIVFCSALTFDNITSSLPQLKSINRIVVLDEITPEPSVPMVQFSSLLREKPIERPKKSKDSDIVVVLTSSGTTGLPKGVMISYDNMKYFCACSTGSFLALTAESVILGLLPLFHGYGYGLLALTAVVGNQFVLLPMFEETLFLSTIQTYRITNLYLVPPLMVFMAKHPLVTQYDLSSVKEIVCGAAPLSQEVTIEVQERMPQADIRQGYGMTESTIIMTMAPPYCKQPNSVGKLAPGLKAKVIDIESGKPVARGEPGEICVKGPCVMAGYCGDAAATRQTIDSEGWLHTGDIGYVDHQGLFYIVDRIKELIKYKGFQVAPAELESLLMGIPGVKDAAVVGLPDLVAGELPVAYIVADPSANLTVESIKSSVNGKLSPQKHLRGVRFIAEIPRNPSGKILRRVLRDSLNSKL